MVVIRLSRGGSKKRPFYHVVVTNSRNARDGRYIERLGYYNPIAAGEEIQLQINKERVDYWLSKGAQPSERVSHLLDNFAEIVAGTVKKKTKPKTAAKKAKATEKKVVAAEPIEEKTEEETPVEAAKEEPTAEKVEEAPVEKQPAEKAE